MDTPMNRRVLDFRTIDEVVADVDQLLSTGYVNVGNWSLGQICRHLVIFVKGSMDGFNGPRVSWLIRLFAPLAVRWMRKTRRMPAGVSVRPLINLRRTPTTRPKWRGSRKLCDDSNCTKGRFTRHRLAAASSATNAWTCT